MDRGVSVQSDGRRTRRGLEGARVQTKMGLRPMSFKSTCKDGKNAHITAYYPNYGLLRNRADLFDHKTGESVTARRLCGVTPKSRTLSEETVAWFQKHTLDELRLQGYRVKEKVHKSREDLIQIYAAHWQE